MVDDLDWSDRASIGKVRKLQWCISACAVKVPCGAQLTVVVGVSTRCAHPVLLYCCSSFRWCGSVDRS